MKKVFFTLAALMVCAASVMADCPTPATATATVTLKRKVTGALDGNFTVDGSGRKVTFSSGNLQYNSETQKWQFAAKQYTYVGEVAGNTNITATGKYNNTGIADLFGWVGASSTWTGLAQNGLSSSKATNNTDGYGNNASEALKSDWGTLMGTGWFTLSTAQWQYLFNTRSGATVNGMANARYTEATINTDGTGVNGIILFPDDFDVSATDGATTWGTINGGSAWGTKLTTAQWNSFEEQGCVFLPAAGYRNGTSVSYVGSNGYYWSSSPYPSYVDYACYVHFFSGLVSPADRCYRNYGLSVRLVRLAE